MTGFDERVCMMNRAPGSSIWMGDSGIGEEREWWMISTITITVIGRYRKARRLCQLACMMRWRGMLMCWWMRILTENCVLMQGKVFISLTETQEGSLLRWPVIICNIVSFWACWGRVHCLRSGTSKKLDSGMTPGRCVLLNSFELGNLRSFTLISSYTEPFAIGGDRRYANLDI